MTALITDAETVLTTTRAVRKRLDFSRPVERSVIEDCLRIAQQAPMGSNLENWRVVAVDDPDVKARLAAFYQEAWVETVEGPLASGEARTTERLSPTVRQGDAAKAQQARILEGVKHVVDHLAEMPVILLLFSVTRIPEERVGGTASGYYGSIFPFAWSVQLALRTRGLGSVMATAMAHKAEKVQVLLGVPDRWRLITMLPVAYTQGLDFRPAPRGSLDAVLGWNVPSETRPA